jgi:hypothetical protein
MLNKANANQFIDDICERLQQAIETYEKTPLSKLEFCSSVYVYFHSVFRQR